MMMVYKEEHMLFYGNLNAYLLNLSGRNALQQAFFFLALQHFRAICFVIVRSDGNQNLHSAGHRIKKVHWSV